MDQIAQGAEAVLWLDKQRILKERVTKGYRYPELDQKIRKFRTRREAKILQRLEEIDFPAPRLQEFSDQRMSLTLDFISGPKLKDVLKQSNAKILAKAMGENIAKLHNHNIIHGDLTTSNMILDKEKINFIDFGLSQFSEKIEDKAVDLFLLDRALASAHGEIYPEVFETALEMYKKYNQDAGKVLEQLQKVKARGRNKNK
ncbi:Kae1-associated serine/threonine protein kinase [Candidatus Woesearchaeota archaeon]|nr:Kae1-associated serine/threonine protein kinase [Candidatus Woesearchaeota archaeon]